MKRSSTRVLFSVLLGTVIHVPLGNTAIIGADGGITLYISYDDATAAGGASWNDNITQVNSTLSASCSPTNTARANAGAPNSPGSCPGGDTCVGREKLTGDLDAFAEYVFQASEGQHYLRRAYLSDNGRAWNQADIKWSIGDGGSSSPQGWQIPFSGINMRSANRRCIHDVLHHEFGHYFYNLPDRYARSTPYYFGTLGGGAPFDVDVNIGDPNTVMSGNFPHLFVDTTNASLTISYNPGSGLISNQLLTPALLADADPSNDGPNRAHHGHTMPFAQDEWSVLPSRHADLAGTHTEGDFSGPNLASMPTPEYVFLGEDSPHPGTILLLDRSGSMGVTTHGITAVQYVQEAGMFLYHSALPSDYVGTQLYNASVETLFDYDEYDPSNTLPFASFRTASGLTNIAAALESAIDTLIAEHGEAGAHGGQIVLMSDGVQTTGPSLWDQVTRATERGIEIHTLSFGNADTATMEAIASTTGGDVITMSEKNDGSELKLGMARELSELRGMTPLHFQKEILKANADDKNGAAYQGTFQLPPLSRALSFYAFLEKGNAADHPLSLIDPAGTVHQATPHNVAQKGRLNGITVLKPLPGKWTFRINGSKRLGGQLPTNDTFELLAYTQDPNLDSQIQVSPSSVYPGRFILSGQLTHLYPLMNIKASASVYAGKTLLASLPLYDDGKTGIDDTPNDGIYSALFDPKKVDNLQKVRIDVRFDTTTTSTPATGAHYETGTEVEALAKQYEALLKTPFTAYATDTVSLRDHTQSDPRITRIEPGKTLTVKPGSRGKLSITTENTYLSKNTVRAALGQGVHVEILDVTQAEKTFNSTVTIAYEVLADAHDGPRTLTLQSNSVQVHATTVLQVAGGTPYGANLRNRENRIKSESLSILKPLNSMIFKK